MILASLNIKKQLVVPHRGTAIVIYTTRSHTQVKKKKKNPQQYWLSIHRYCGKELAGLWGGGRVGMCHCRREGQFQGVSCLCWSSYQTFNGVAYPPGTYPGLLR